MCVVNHLKTFFSKRPVAANEMLTKHLCSISVDVLPSSERGFTSHSCFSHTTLVLNAIEAKKVVCCGHNNTFQAETCSRGRYCWA